MAPSNKRKSLRSQHTPSPSSVSTIMPSLSPSTEHPLKNTHDDEDSDNFKTPAAIATTKIGKNILPTVVLATTTTSTSTVTKKNNKGMTNTAHTNNGIGNVVTPGSSTEPAMEVTIAMTPKPKSNAKRSLFPTSNSNQIQPSLLSSSSLSLVTPVTTLKRSQSSSTEEDNIPKEQVPQQEPPAKRRLIFGKYYSKNGNYYSSSSSSSSASAVSSYCPRNVQEVYKLVRKHTGSIGGNGYCGPIYGELTMGSMQKMILLMMEYTKLNSTSYFLDVGSGIGKPNLHVAQYPKVAFSCGVELEQTRWTLGMTCLKAVLDKAVTTTQTTATSNTTTDSMAKQQEDCNVIHGNTIFLHTDITEAKTLDPFTHVYMFSIGFPPPLWFDLAKMWNESSGRVEYLICYHGPKAIIRKYNFHVELLTQTTTSMHGSSENHMGYIYKRIIINKTTKSKQPSSSPSLSSPRARNNNVSDCFHCDYLFRDALALVQKGLPALHDSVTQQIEATLALGRPKRSRQKIFYQ